MADTLKDRADQETQMGLFIEPSGAALATPGTEPAMSEMAGGSFPEVIGQERVKRLFTRIIRSGRLAHGYLFVGPDGCGRLAMALELGRTLNCPAGGTAPEGKPCSCDSCRRFRKLLHPNLHLIIPLPRLTKKGDEAVAGEALMEFISKKGADPYAPPPQTASGTGQILIDHIREIRNQLSLVQDRPGVRIVIIDPADRMTEEAANALLKHLEEPPERCCLILVAGSTRDLLPTIVSRCQFVRFAVLSRGEIAAALTARRALPAAEAAAVARLAAGSYTRATVLVEGETTGRLETALRFLRAAARGHAPELTALADEWTRSGSRRELTDRLGYISIWLQDALTWNICGETERKGRQLIMEQDRVVERIASRYQASRIGLALHEIEEAQLAIEANINPALTLLALGLKMRRILG